MYLGIEFIGDELFGVGFSNAGGIVGYGRAKLEAVLDPWPRDAPDSRALAAAVESLRMTLDLQRGCGLVTSLPCSWFELSRPRCPVDPTWDDAADHFPYGGVQPGQSVVLATPLPAYHATQNDRRLLSVIPRARLAALEQTFASVGSPFAGFGIDILYAVRSLAAVGLLVSKDPVMVIRWRPGEVSQAIVHGGNLGYVWVDTCPAGDSLSLQDVASSVLRSMSLFSSRRGVSGGGTVLLVNAPEHVTEEEFYEGTQMLTLRIDQLPVDSSKSSLWSDVLAGMTLPRVD